MGEIIHLEKKYHYETINRRTKTTPCQGHQVPGTGYRHRHRDGHGADLVQCHAHDHHRKQIADPWRYGHHHPVENHRVV